MADIILILIIVAMVIRSDVYSTCMHSYMYIYVIIFVVCLLYITFVTFHVFFFCTSGDTEIDLSFSVAIPKYVIEL